MSESVTRQSAPHARRRIRTAFQSRASVVMIVVNLSGVALYLRQASYGWADPVERATGITSVTGEAFVWFLAIMPVVAAYLMINVAWLVIAFSRRRSGIPLALVGALWVVVVAVDVAHH